MSFDPSLGLSSTHKDSVLKALCDVLMFLDTEFIVSISFQSPRVEEIKILQFLDSIIIRLVFRLVCLTVVIFLSSVLLVLACPSS